MYWNAKWSCQIWRLKTFSGAKLSSLSRFQRRWHHQQLPGSRTPPQAFWKVSQHYHQDYRLVYFFVTKLSPLRIELLAQTAKFGLRLEDEISLITREHQGRFLYNNISLCRSIIWLIYDTVQVLFKTISSVLILFSKEYKITIRLSGHSILNNIVDTILNELMKYTSKGI